MIQTSVITIQQHNNNTTSDASQMVGCTKHTPTPSETPSQNTSIIKTTCKFGQVILPLPAENCILSNQSAPVDVMLLLSPPTLFPVHRSKLSIEEHFLFFVFDHTKYLNPPSNTPIPLTQSIRNRATSSNHDANRRDQTS